MKQIAVLKTESKQETRITLLPSDAARLVKAGVSLSVEAGLGELIKVQDAAYQDAGATIIKDRKKLITNADIVVSLEKPATKDMGTMKAGTVCVALMDPFRETKLVDELAKAKISAVSMEMVPRSTRAQKMDVLSSQASLAGYVATILAAEELDKIFPMMMTPAGTIKPSRVFIIGAGVAGLQAIASAKRLGARVEAFDTRPVVAEEVRSLGAKFIEVDLGETGQTKDGYAKQLTDEQIKIQQQAMADVCAYSDVVITTAQLFGRPAPRIITEEMIKRMQPGSVIVDLAVETGGNVAGSKVNEVVEVNGVKIIGYGNLPGRVAVHASQMLSANFTNFILEFWDKENSVFTLNQEDEIIKAALITHDGAVIHPMLNK